jgi:hypothetical protein
MALANESSSRLYEDVMQITIDGHATSPIFACDESTQSLIDDRNEVIVHQCINLCTCTLSMVPDGGSG